MSVCIHSTDRGGNGGPARNGLGTSIAGGRAELGVGPGDRAGWLGYQPWLVANMAQTTLPIGPGSVQPHSSQSEDTT
jgi:hypothetical protein